MQIFLRAVQILGAVVLINIAASAWAEAPVYDADSMPQQQFENIGNSGNSDQGQDLPPPPPPSEGAFVPGQAPAAMPGPGPSSSVEQRVKRVEQQVNNLQNNDLSARVDSLQSQIQTLQGQVDQLTKQLDQVKTQQKSMYSDIDKRLSQNANTSKSSDTDVNAANNDDVAAGQAGVTKQSKKIKQAAKVADDNDDKPIAAAAAATADADTGAAKSADGQPNVAEEQQIYQTAYNLIKAKKYDDAVQALQGMLKKYPSGQFASNAHYWLGELYGLMGKNDQAMTEFSTVVKNYPESPRISDAQLKIGLIYAAQSKWSDAKSAFRRVINRYPGTASARLASEQLKELKQAGH